MPGGHRDNLRRGNSGRGEEPLRLAAAKGRLRPAKLSVGSQASAVGSGRTPRRDYEKMVVQTRNKHKELPSKGVQSPRGPLRGRRGPDHRERGPLTEDKCAKGSRPSTPGPTHLTGSSSGGHHKVARVSPLRRLLIAIVRRLLCLVLEKLPMLQHYQSYSWNLTLALGAFVGILHWAHLTTLFENDRHFSHLSTLEREMTFRTEMGLYYSYFKTMIEAPSFLRGLWMTMNDRLTEFPLVINAVKRFHLYPEVILAFWYRLYTGTMDLIGIQTKVCWNVSRGQGLNPVESCEGLGDPACFYITVIFVLNGLMMTLFFIYGTYLSGSQVGGLITVLCYFFNHGESTRVMWTPPLRESFSYPFHVLQMLIITHVLRSRQNCKKDFIALIVSNVAFMLPWQFAQFILFTQMASLFPMYVVGYIEPYKFLKIIGVNMVSIAICFILMFGNRTYLSSYFASSLIITWAIMKKRNKIQKLQSSECTFWIIQCFLWWSGTIILKVTLSQLFAVSDHIQLSDLITARILRYTDFDTLMYTCAPEFDFMEKETPLRYTKTLLLPVVALISYLIFRKVIPDILYMLSTGETFSRKQLQQDESKNPPTILLVFHELQLFAFAILAVFIMRLKLFLTPHMSVMASLICSKRLFGRFFDRIRFGNFVLALLMVMSIQGWLNLQSQWSIIGEFSNAPQEELLQWIRQNTRPDAVFAGAMPTMASVKLSTLRPIVNHPHYEDGGLRARTKIVYSVYSRKTAKEVRDKLLQLHVNYYILEEAWCVVRTKPGCSMLEIWDVEDPMNAAKPSLCSILVKDGRPYFTSMFQNSMYRVFKVN
ncbi:probable C-mannosyltransferase DPY19L2 [Antechinus flavipes]|uniref:probable C-mannosyltransferase DPY19L2 n=1 Tax=Antechinus flavipes TaxID=38775 RepID=UPI0022356E9A|nr:probable C-mannosyltransferase DPY19L2 [Antechinus flavipes]